MDIKKKKKKSTDYSRRGCLQCKKSHVKCDEKFPTCSRCLKRGTECNYYTNFLLESANSAVEQKTTSKTTIVWENNQFTGVREKLEEETVSLAVDSSTVATSEPDPAGVVEQTVEISPLNTVSKLSVNGQQLSPKNAFLPIPKLSENVTAKCIPGDNRQKLTPLQAASLMPSPSFLTNLSSGKSPHNLSISDSSEIGSQFSVSHIRLNDLIEVGESDLDYLSSLSKEYETMTYLYNEKNHPNLHAFDIPWDGGPMYYFIGTIEKNDPMALNNGILLNDQSMIDFTWTLARITKFFYTFVLYSETSLMSVLDLCFKLGTKSSIFQSILTYHCSVHIVRLYNITENEHFTKLWDFNVRIPAFKQCIDYLREGLENSLSFSDLVILTFAVVIIFSGNASDKSWRAHLNGCYQLISKSYSLKSTAQMDDQFDLAALALYDIIVEWYNHTASLAALSSGNGFPGRDLNSFRNKTASNIAIANNGINLMAGHCSEITDLISDIHTFINVFQKREQKLSGLNFVYFILNEKSAADIVNEIKIIGYKYLHQLNIISYKYKYERLELEDYRMDLSMKYCNLLYMNGLKLLIIYFFIGDRDKGNVRPILRDILDLIYSMPYRSSCAIICHWNIYLGGLVSLLIGDFEIYGHFLGILKVFQMNGMDVQSMDILEKVKLILFEKDYEKLLSPDNDFVIY